MGLCIAQRINAPVQVGGEQKSAQKREGISHGDRCDGALNCEFQPGFVKKTGLKAGEEVSADSGRDKMFCFRQELIKTQPNYSSVIRRTITPGQ